MTCFLNAVIYGGIVSQLLLSSHFLNHFFIQCYNSLFGHLQHAVFSLSRQIVLTYTIVSLMVIDFGIFLAHYCMHRIPFLWQFHKVHHSAEVLTPITLYRMHPVDLFVTMNIATIFHAIIHSLFLILMQHQSVTFTVYSLNIFTFLFYCLDYNLRHSHVWVQYPRWLSQILISPAQHQIHHSCHPSHFNKNMGLLFAIRDGVFWTLYIPKQRESLRLGLNKKHPNPYSSISALYTKPFRDATRLIFKKRTQKQSRRSIK